ncbi:T9SS type A sorting domain-containing protein [Fulvivirga sediminis]|uniref:T9SS type A sorting domain-containing protein n=1 Tax=Fulvivirga sediminis TaxID=2803949 RepID=A0A937F8D2_9BACT|nr:T9SS type A sorting domain-containing protein [Fulvivirga sediminis]MBL3657605.1 T9SS type A sorting domain-containing protein [Fulvivirga sediminis]
MVVEANSFVELRQFPEFEVAFAEESNTISSSEIALEDNKPGIYLLVLEVGGKSVVKRIMIK